VVCYSQKCLCADGGTRKWSVNGSISSVFKDQVYFLDPADQEQIDIMNKCNCWRIFLTYGTPIFRKVDTTVPAPRVARTEGLLLSLVRGLKFYKVSTHTKSVSRLSAWIIRRILKFFGHRWAARFNTRVGSLSQVVFRKLYRCFHGKQMGPIDRSPY